MPAVGDVCDFLEEFAPRRLAEDWDNVGLLVGDPRRPLSRLMTCLTVTPSSAREAIAGQAELIVTHHPLPFRPLKRLTTDSVAGSLLWELARAGIAVHSPHTAFDSARCGINQQLAEGLGLADIRPLVPGQEDAEPLGSGRWGSTSAAPSLGQLAARLQSFLAIDALQRVGKLSAEIRSVAVACGSGGSFLATAAEAGCDLLVTGEASFHTCLEAQARGLALLLTGHFASERFAVVRLATVLQEHFPDLEVWACRDEHDPLRWIGPGPGAD